MAFTVGETVGPYVLLEQLGQGGMATVFKAYHPALDRHVAIKALHPAFTQESNFLARFRREAQVVARLEHPNIVPIYDFAEHEGRPYLVMKFIEGETLKARLKRGPLSKEELQNVVVSVGAALDYAHKQGILHRDIKPSNVLLATDGRVYLADFGLARIAQAGESTISSDVMLGTPQYISPEQAMGQRDLDNGTDIYSFGVLLYELLVGQVPYNADTPYSIIHDHIYAALPLPRSRKPDIPEAVERVVLKALAKERDDRFTDIASMVEAWKQATETPVEAEPAPTRVIDEDKLAGIIPLTPLPTSDGALAFGETALSKRDETPMVSQALSATGEARLPISAAEPPAGMLASQALAPPAQPAEEITAAAQSKHKSRRTWLIVGGGVLTLCLCLFVLSVLSNRAAGRLKKTPLAGLASTPEQIESTSVQAPTALPVSYNTPPASPETPSLTPDQSSINAVIEAAKKRVSQNPTDVKAHLVLASAYWDANMSVQAQQELEQAVKYTGQDPDPFIKSGDNFFHREQWLPAAWMYFQAANISPQPLALDVTQQMNQALYLSANDSRFLGLFGRVGLDRLDPQNQQIITIAHARYVLYYVGVERAEDLIEPFIEKQVDRSELKLLVSEIDIKKNDQTTAKAILRNLIDDSKTPLWVVAVARNILNKISG